MGWLSNEDYEGSYGGYVPPAPAYSSSIYSPAVAAMSNYTLPSQIATELSPTSLTANQSKYYGGVSHPTGASQMSYDYGGSSWYENTYGQSQVYAPQSLYTPPPIDYSQLAQTPTLPGYSPYQPPPPVYVSPNIEQGQTTAYKPTPQYVQVPQAVYTPPPINYSQLTQTPYIPQYQQQRTGMPAGGGGGSSGGSSGGSAPQQQQRQQPQQQQRPLTIQINNIPNRSGSGQAGGNVGARYGFGTRPIYRRGNYGGTVGYGGQTGTGYGNRYGSAANYNAPSIVPYLIVGGLGLLAYNVFSKKEHR